MLKALRPYLPNTGTRLALVSLDDQRPFRAYWPIRFTQIVGGKRWSLSLCVFRTPTPELLQHEENGPAPSGEALAAERDRCLALAIAAVCDCAGFDEHPGDCAATPIINRFASGGA